MNIAMLVKRDDIRRVINRVLDGFEEEAINKVVKNMEKGYDNSIQVEDNDPLLIFEDDGCTIVPTTKELSIERMLELVNIFRAERKGLLTPLKLVEVEELLDPMSPTSIQITLDMLAKVISERELKK